MKWASAARDVKRKGLAKGENRGKKGEVCIVTAIEDNLDPGESLHWYVDELTKQLGYKPSDWNDLPKTSKSDAVNLLYRMASLT